METARPRSAPTRAAALSAALLLAAVAVVALVVRAGSGHDGEHGAPPRLGDPGMAHVHGLGVDPSDGTLYAATHFGLFVVADGSARRVGNAQDTMGFAVAGPRHFLASGHPDPAEGGGETLLGLIESTDGGRTWQSLSLRGEADFHALRVAGGSVHGYDATSGTFQVSPDGRTWEPRSRLPMRDFALDPEDPEVVLATTPEALVRSADGGRTWSVVPDAPPLVVLSWSPDGLIGVDALGTVSASGDAGATWSGRGSAGAAPEALTVDDDRLYVATADGRIAVSADGGRTFRELYRAR